MISRAGRRDGAQTGTDGDWYSLVRVRFFFVVLFGNVIFRNFVRAYFALIGVGRALDAAYGFGFEVLPFLFEFRYGLRVADCPRRKSLRVAGLSSRS